MHKNSKTADTPVKLIIMTKPTFFVEEDKILATLFEEGMDNLHLCKPGAEPVYSERLLTLLPEDYLSRITVHEHFYLKQEFRLRGIHLDSPMASLPTGYRGNYSITCHSTDELKEAKKQANYVFLDTPLEELRANGGHNQIDKKVYACCNITLPNIQSAKELGFGGVVVCDDLWQHFEIHSQQDYKELLQHFSKLRKAVG